MALQSANVLLINHSHRYNVITGNNRKGSVYKKKTIFKLQDGKNNYGSQSMLESVVMPTRSRHFWRKHSKRKNFQEAKVGLPCW